MFALYIQSSSSSLHGYWTGKFQRTDRILDCGVYHILKSIVNIPVLTQNVWDKSMKLYKTKENAIKAAENMPFKLQEELPNSVNKYWCRWSCNVIDIDGKMIVHNVPENMNLYN